MRVAWVIGGAGCGVLLGACVNLLAYHCSDDIECRSTNDQGWCEDAGFCSYPDQECPSGRRYSDLAGSLASRCTGVGPGAVGSTSTDPVVDSGDLVDSGDPSTAGIDPRCGNGIVEGEEECDELDMVDGDGCNVDCSVGGSVRWERYIAAADGKDARLFGLTRLLSGDVVGAGSFDMASTDILLSRWTVEGEEIERVIHNVNGSLDDAFAIYQGGTGRLYVCGESRVGGASRPWIGRWEVPMTDGLTAERVLPSPFPGSCDDIAYIDSGRLVAGGGNGNSAWVVTFKPAGLNDEESEVIDDPTPDTMARFRSVARAPNGDSYVTSQIEGKAVAYLFSAVNELGDPIVQTQEIVQPQSMLVTSTSIFLAGRLENVDTLIDLWIGAFSITGEPQWVYAPNLSALDEVEDIALGPDGSIYATGHVTSSNNNPDRWVAKLDPQGALVWSRNDYARSEIGDDRGRSIIVLPDSEGGDLVVVGEVEGLNGDREGWIARLAP